jgi:hypothetical protein
MNLVLALCGLLSPAGCTAPPVLANMALWLGYISSTINPLIYTVFNVKFRSDNQNPKIFRSK